MAEGQVADLVLYDLTSLSLLPRADPFTSLLLSGARPSGPGAGSQVEAAWVNGACVVEKGTSATVDIESLRRDLLKADDGVYAPAGVPPGLKSAFEVEYRAALGLDLAV